MRFLQYMYSKVRIGCTIDSYCPQTDSATDQSGTQSRPRRTYQSGRNTITVITRTNDLVCFAICDSMHRFPSSGPESSLSSRAPKFSPRSHLMLLFFLTTPPQALRLYNI